MSEPLNLRPAKPEELHANTRIWVRTTLPGLTDHRDTDTLYLSGRMLGRASKFEFAPYSVKVYRPYLEPTPDMGSRWTFIAETMPIPLENIWVRDHSDPESPDLKEPELQDLPEDWIPVPGTEVWVEVQGLRKTMVPGVVKGIATPKFEGRWGQWFYSYTVEINRRSQEKVLSVSRKDLRVEAGFQGEGPENEKPRNWKGGWEPLLPDSLVWVGTTVSPALPYNRFPPHMRYDSVECRNMGVVLQIDTDGTVWVSYIEGTDTLGQPIVRIYPYPRLYRQLLSIRA